MAYSGQSMNEGTARSVADNVADKATDLANKAGKQIDKAIGTAESTMRSVADQGRDAGERVQVVAGNFKGAVEKSADGNAGGGCRSRFCARRALEVVIRS